MRAEKKIRALVIGSLGQLAQSFKRSEHPEIEVITQGRGDLDLRDKSSLVASVDRVRPDIVINAAAYTHVDRAEVDRTLAMELNRDGPGTLATLTSNLSIPFIHFSTDCVFDGTLDRPYLETDSPNPLNWYGVTKLAGEQSVLEKNGDALIFRVSWLYSAWGRNFLWAMLNLAQTRDKLEIVNDQYGAPTSAAAVASATLAIACTSVCGVSPSGIFHMTSPDHTSRFVFAKAIFEASTHWRNGRVPKLTGVPTSQFPTPATRALNARLDCSALASAFAIELPNWQNGISNTIAALEPEFGVKL